MDDDPFALPPTADDRAVLNAFLDWHRSALMRKCAGLTDEQLRLRSVPSSNLTLIGLVRHLAGVERWYFQAIVDGRFPGSLFTATDDVDEDFNDIETATGEKTFALWRTEVETSRRIAAERPLETVSRAPINRSDTSGREYTLSWVLTHMIDEYARHNGHADIIREAIDGEVGE